MSNDTTQLERTNLEAHVDLCAIRYAALDARLDTVEQKVNEIHTDIKTSHHSLIKVLIGTGGTIIASILSVVVVLLMQ